MAICGCSMAGTAACRYCNNNSFAEKSNTITYTTIGTDKLYYVLLPPEPTEEQKRELEQQWFPSIAKYLDNDYGVGRFS